MYYTRRQLQLFLAIAESGGVSAAAKACHVTQPTVSVQLRELTRSVGVPLFEQIGRKLHLTQAGEALVTTARAMNQEWANFEQQIAAMKGLTEGRLCVATVSTAKYFVPRMLGKFCKRFPGIDIALSVQNRDGVLSRLKANADDMYIMSKPPLDQDMEVIPFLSNPLVVIAPRNHPLAARKRIRLHELENEPFILREPGSGTRLAVEAYFAKKGFSPRVRLELGNNEAIKQAVDGELGLSVISTHALRFDADKELLTVLNVAGFPLPSRWLIVYPRGKRLSPIAAAFLAYLKEESRELEARLDLLA